MIAAIPGQGGATWAVLNWLLGLRRLGHDVLFVESLSPENLEPRGTSLEESANARYFGHVVRESGLERRAALLLDGSMRSVGLASAEVIEFARRADILINLSGLLARDDLLGPVRTRVYVDLDPAFTQLWHIVQGLDLRFDGHTHFATVGDAIGSPHCDVPTCGLAWHPVRPPVVLERWPFEEPRGGAITTVANWRGYGSIECAGTFYGQKAHSLRSFLEVPRRTGEDFVLALSIHPDETADLAALRRNGWKRVDPVRVAGSPRRYQRFLRDSLAEFGIAKSGYVNSRCGWFSDRSACYLATGRPVLTHDTGFTSAIPSGSGLFRFRNEDDVITAVESLRKDPARHAREARHLAERFFDSDRVLADLIERVA
jgi:hypothetical protein